MSMVVVIANYSCFTTSKRLPMAASWLDATIGNFLIGLSDFCTEIENSKTSLKLRTRLLWLRIIHVLPSVSSHSAVQWWNLAGKLSCQTRFTWHAKVAKGGILLVLLTLCTHFVNSKTLLKLRARLSWLRIIHVLPSASSHSAVQWWNLTGKLSRRTRFTWHANTLY